MTAAETGTVDDLRDRYLDAIREGDRKRAFDVADRALDDGVELSRLYVEVFQPSLRQIGQLWQDNEITVADEHLATAITQTALLRSYQRIYQWKPSTDRSLIAACADIERHELGLRMICDLLDVEGWQTTYLGAAVPVGSLVEMIQRRKPDAVALSISIDPHLPRLRDAIAAIRERIDDPPLILVGGRPFLQDPELAERIGGDLTALDAISAVRELTRRFPHDG